MKTLIQLALVVFLLGNVNAQTTPEPPTVPTTSTSSTTTYSSSVSVSKSDDDYRFKARFHKSRYSAVKALLTEELGEKGLSKNGKSYSWTRGNDSFTCELSNSRLKMNLDYESNDSKFINKVEALGKKLKFAISGGNPEDDVKHAEERLARAKEELERSKKELKRIEQEVKNARRN